MWVFYRPIIFCLFLFVQLYLQSLLRAVKYVLSVQHSVIKFLLKIFIRQKLLGSRLEQLILQYLVYIGSQFRIFDYQFIHQPLNLLRENTGQRRHFSVDDLHGQHVNIGTVKRWFETAHFIQKYSQAPNVAFEVIGLIRYNLGAEVVWRAHDCCSLVRRFVQNFGNAKVTQFYNSILRQKYILCFQISVQNLAIVNMLHR